MIQKMIAENRKARREYEIETVFEAGIVLLGSEVKSLRDGKANIAESYISDEKNELFLINANIAEYTAANRFNHAPKRNRKLLLKRREISKISGAIKQKGRTAIPLKLYFNQKGMIKLEFALAVGRKLYDKRQVEKERDWNRQKARMLKYR